MNFSSVRNQIPCTVQDIQVGTTTTNVKLSVFNSKLTLYSTMMNEEATQINLQKDDRVLAMFDAFSIIVNIPTRGVQYSCKNMFVCKNLKVSVQSSAFCELDCYLNKSIKLVTTVTASTCHMLQSYFQPDQEPHFELLVNPANIMIAKQMYKITEEN